MKLRKVEWWEIPRGKASVSVLPVHTKETKVETTKVELDTDALEVIRKDVDKLKKRRPEYFPGGSGGVGSYHQVTSNEMRFQASSFNPGINVIGVASNVATTIWIPAKLDQNHLIAVKDELGVAATKPITVRVF